MAVKLKRDIPSSALAAIFVASTFVSALLKVRDTETWLHLSLGRLIWQLKAVPKVEMFTYPTFGEPFSYNSWLFGLLCYGLNAHLGPAALVLLKASSIALAFYILLKDSIRPHKNYALAVVVLIATLVLTHYRFVLRPDLFLMIFLSFSIFSLNAYLYDGKKYIYALPLIHLLWANIHASVILMFVPFLAFIFGSLVQRRLNGKGIGAEESLTNAQIKTVAVVFLISFLMTLVTPYFSLHQYIYGPKYVTSEWHTLAISEMLPPKGFDRNLLYVVVAAVAASFVLAGRRLSFIHLFLIIPFIALPFISGRFRFILAITAAPVIVRNLSVFIEGRKWQDLFRKKSVIALAAICVIAYLFISFAKIGPFWALARFGFGFDYSEMPKGAIEYMDKEGIYGKMLNTFHFGQYITWTGYPKREVSIDARGHLPPDLLHKIPHATSSNPLLDELHSRFGFESILVELNDETPVFTHPGWALVYWDDLSLLYLRKDGPYADIAQKDAYTQIKPEAGFGYFLENPGDPAGVERELRRNIDETDSARGKIYLGLFYNSKGRFKEAIDLLSRVGPEYPDLKYVSLIAIGDSYKGLGDAKNSLAAYKKALSITKDAYVLYRIAVLQQGMGNRGKAVENYKKALEASDDMMNIYPPIIEAFEGLGLKKDADAARKKYASRKAASDVDIHFSIARKAYFKNEMSTAIQQFQQALDKDPGNPEALTCLGYLYLQKGSPREALDFFNRALASDPQKAKGDIINLPHAYFGIALIYRQMGNTDKAVEHLRAYLKVEPNGGYAAKANELIQEMSKTSQ